MNFDIIFSMLKIRIHSENSYHGFHSQSGGYGNAKIAFVAALTNVIKSAALHFVNNNTVYLIIFYRESIG